MTKIKSTHLALLAVLLSPAAANADPISILLESDVNQSAGNEVYLANFDSLTDIVNNNLTSIDTTQVNINANFSAGGVAYDGSQFHMLLESDVDASAGSEIFLVTFNSLADLVTNTFDSVVSTLVNINANFSAGGFTYDGSQFHILLESIVNASAGSEIFLATFNSLADLVTNTLDSVVSTQVNINANFSAGGFDYDGNQFHMLLESDVNASAGNEVFLANFDSLTDIVNNNLTSIDTTQVNINANFSAGGLFSQLDLTDPGPGPTPVPEPGMLSLLAIGLACMAWARRRKIV